MTLRIFESKIDQFLSFAGLYYKEIEVDMQEHLRTHKVSEPYDSPTHAGGLFAIDRKYFIELGTYDEGLLVWGGK